MQGFEVLYERYSSVALRVVAPCLALFYLIALSCLLSCCCVTLLTIVLHVFLLELCHLASVCIIVVRVLLPWCPLYYCQSCVALPHAVLLLSELCHFASRCIIVVRVVLLIMLTSALTFTVLPHGVFFFNLCYKSHIVWFFEPHHYNVHIFVFL